MTNIQSVLFQKTGRKLWVINFPGGVHPKKSIKFPRLLSQTGIYESITENRIHPGLIPYQVNSPLWSDGAIKERFIGIPGTQTIPFQKAKSWDFPDGTVLVKTFSLPVARVSQTGNEPDSESSLTRIETRLMTRQKGEWHGYSYQWNADQTDAVLVDAAGHDETYQITSDDDSNAVIKQTWHYPSRSECMVCHSRASNFVLGLSVRQTNLTLTGHDGPQSQLEYFRQMGLFHNSDSAKKDEASSQSEFEFPEAVTNLPSLANPADTTQPLENRVRSYLHSNCANCHVKEGGGNSKIILANDRSLSKTGLIDVTPIHDSFGITDAKLIKPAESAASILLQRMKRRGRGQMPPLATSLVDQQAVEMISKWRVDSKKMKHFDLLKLILDESGYSALLKNKKDLENENRLENIKELLSAMKEFDNLESFLDHVSLATSIDQDWEGEKINMMTMHAAKGLEFDIVFLPGWEEGLFPHQKSIEEKGHDGLEEERRLAYVGITRAKKKAIISFSMNRFYQGDWIDSMASRFIDELPEENLEKNSFYDEGNETFDEFEFNQDLELDNDSKRSPGWIRYQKRIKW